MSVEVRRSSAASCFESILALSSAFPESSSNLVSPPLMVAEQQELDQPTKYSVLNPHLVEEEDSVKGDNDGDEAERPPGQLDIWSSIQAQKAQQEAQHKEEPYVHPLMRRSSSLLSQKSLEVCTESLGSETGSDDFFSSDDETDFFSLNRKNKEAEQQQEEDQFEYDDDDEEEDESERARNRNGGRKELVKVNYHCSISRRSSQPRSFPPPLPSISRRDGPCLQIRPHRRDGRLVVEAVTVPSQNYLHAERQNGRLLLSFINTTTAHNPCTATETITNVAETTAAETELIEQFQQTEDVVADEEEVLEVEEDQAAEEEVEVVDRGTVVEVKVSTQPQQSSGGGGAAAMKVHRSSIVINKFVSCMPANTDQENTYVAISAEAGSVAPLLSPVRRLATTSTTTAAAAAVAASSLSALSSADGSHSSTNDNKLLFTSRRRNREELLHDMRRCSQLRKPLFIWEPCCIATSS